MLFCATFSGSSQQIWFFFFFWSHFFLQTLMCGRQNWSQTNHCLSLFTACSWICYLCCWQCKGLQPYRMMDSYNPFTIAYLHSSCSAWRHWSRGVRLLQMNDSCLSSLLANCNEEITLGLYNCNATSYSAQIIIT